MELNRVYNEDCLYTLEKFPLEFIDLVVTSPPYDKLKSYKGFVFDYKLIAQKLFLKVKTGGVVVWVVGDSTKNGTESGTSFEQALYFKSVGFNLYDTMIYEKDNYMPLTHRRYEQAFEYMFVFSKGRPKTFNPLLEQIKYPRDRVIKMRDGDTIKVSRQTSKTHRIKGNVWNYKVGGGHIATDEFAHKHPAPFPENLASDHILSWSNSEDVVYDPMAGSGTVLKMAKLLNRNWIGSEISTEYCKLIEQRLGTIDGTTT